MVWYSSAPACDAKHPEKEAGMASMDTFSQRRRWIFEFRQLNFNNLILINGDQAKGKGFDLPEGT